MLTDSPGDAELCYKLSNVNGTITVHAALERHDHNLKTYIDRQPALAGDPIRAMQRLSHHSLYFLRSLQRVHQWRHFTKELTSDDLRRSLISVRDALDQENELLASASGHQLEPTEVGPDNQVRWSWPVSTSYSPHYNTSGRPSPVDSLFQEPWETAFRPLSASDPSLQASDRQNDTVPPVLYARRPSLPIMPFSEAAERARSAIRDKEQGKKIIWNFGPPKSKVQNPKRAPRPRNWNVRKWSKKALAEMEKAAVDGQEH